MSLINQMLKDLDKRNAPAGGVQPLAGEMRDVVMSARSTSRLPRRALLLAVAIGAGVLTWQIYLNLGAKPVAPAPQAAATAAPSIAVEPALEAPAPAASVAAAAPPVTPEPPAPAPATEAAPALMMDEPLPAVTGAVSTAGKKMGAKSATMASGDAMASSAKPISTAEEQKRESPEKPVSSTSGESQAAVLKVVSPQQRSDNAYRHAVAVLQQGQVTEAKESLRQALNDDPLNHNARQLLAGLLVEEAHQGEAIALLQDGLRLAPEQTWFALVLARLQVEAGDRNAGLATLQSGLPMAGNDPEYHALLATLLQREERHDEAVGHYLTALRSDPAMPNWLVGIGISLQAMGKLADATEAYARAQQTGMLTPDLAQFVNQRLKQVKR